MSTTPFDYVAESGPSALTPPMTSQLFLGIFLEFEHRSAVLCRRAGPEDSLSDDAKKPQRPLDDNDHQRRGRDHH